MKDKNDVTNFPNDDDEQDPEEDHNVLDFDEVPTEPEDGDALVVEEIGHLPSLKEYQALDIDRKPDVLKVWIDDLADGSPIGDGWFEVGVPHYQAHDIPERYLARPKASLAKITKEARTVSVKGRVRSRTFPSVTGEEEKFG